MHRHGDRAQADLQLLVDQRDAFATHLFQQVEEIVHAGDRAFGTRPQRIAFQIAFQRVARQRRQQHAAHRGAVRRQAAARPQADRHDAHGFRARHVQDVIAVEHAQRAGFVHVIAQGIQHRLCGRCHRRRGDIGAAHAQHARQQHEATALFADVTELFQRVQHAPYRCARDARIGADLRHGHFARVLREHAQHGQAAAERGHEIRIALVVLDLLHQLMGQAAILRWRRRALGATAGRNGRHGSSFHQVRPCMVSAGTGNRYPRGAAMQAAPRGTAYLRSGSA